MSAHQSDLSLVKVGDGKEVDPAVPELCEEPEKLLRLVPRPNDQ